MTTTPESADIVVTGVRFKQADDPSGGDFFGFYTYIPRNILSPFGESGGGEAFEVVRITTSNGDLVVRFPGYAAPVRMPAAEWARMTPEQQGEFLKIMSEFRESPMLLATLNVAQAAGVPEIVIRYDNLVHHPRGTTEEWKQNQAGEAEVYYAQNADGTDDTTRILGVTININPAVIPGANGVNPTWQNTQGETIQVTFGLVILHELRHIFYPGKTSAEEIPVRQDADRMFDDIFNTPGMTEQSPSAYTASQTFVGSMHNDISTGSIGGDTLSGLSGNDNLNGGAGDDLVMGGVGMDVLSGGSGTNHVLGGLDADTYIPTAGVTAELITETGGVDIIDLSRISIDAVSFMRAGDTLIMSYTTASGSEQVQIEGQFADGGKVEQFAFAEGTYAASYVESLTGSPSGGGVCYDGPNPVICGPFGMPVVLDLDGDGIELVAVGDAHARFDMNGDGERERIGWVGPDDGILALDRNGNGRIDDFSEISFLQDFLGAGTDLEGLLAYDQNGDGFLTAADDRFSDFLVWRDENGNGHSEKKELFTLDELGIVSIGLERMNIALLDIDAATNQILATSVFRTSDGQDHLLGDVALYAQLADCGCHGGQADPILIAVSEWTA